MWGSDVHVTVYPRDALPLLDPGIVRHRVGSVSLGHHNVALIRCPELRSVRFSEVAHFQSVARTSLGGCGPRD